MVATKNGIDSRFDTSKWNNEALKASTSKEKLEVNQEDDDNFDEESEESEYEEEDQEITGTDIEDDDDSATEQQSGPIVQPLSHEELSKFEEKQKKKGIIYISRIPYGMTVAKVRHLLSGFGEVERIYLQDGREKERGEKLTGRAAKSAHFTEGWIEFSNKKVAKTVAEMLNAQPIGAASGGSGGGKGGKKAGGKTSSRRWRDEIWTMKYLHGFKWGMLSEQMANERASRASRVRAELSQSTFEQKDYLRKVERARVMRDKQARLDAKQQKQKDRGMTNETKLEITPSSKSLPQPRQHTFKQREAILRDVREQKSKSNQKRSIDEDQSSAERKQKFARSDNDPSRADNGRSKALQGALSKIF